MNYILIKVVHDVIQCNIAGLLDTTESMQTLWPRHQDSNDNILVELVLELRDATIYLEERVQGKMQTTWCLQLVGVAAARCSRTILSRARRV